jgi:hypothetical protein
MRALYLLLRSQSMRLSALHTLVVRVQLQSVANPSSIREHSRLLTS